MSTNHTYVAWQSEPNVRGTWGLVSSCVITLTLCVYTAVHLNVPERNITKSKRYLRRLKWVFCGILAPEIVVFTAWRQWSSAIKLTKEMQKLQKQSTATDKHKYKPWTLTHSFFAGMGGFVIDSEEQDGLPYVAAGQTHRTTLSAKGVLTLARLGDEIPQLSKSTIMDRSKADEVAKILASLQAAYIILQVVGRLANALPVTFLEVNTVGHSACALVMFLFWLRKPLNVEDPIGIKGPHAKSLSALACIGTGEAEPSALPPNLRLYFHKSEYYSSFLNLDSFMNLNFAWKTVDSSAPAIMPIPLDFKSAATDLYSLDYIKKFDAEWQSHHDDGLPNGGLRHVRCFVESKEIEPEPSATSIVSARMKLLGRRTTRKRIYPPPLQQADISAGASQMSVSWFPSDGHIPSSDARTFIFAGVQPGIAEDAIRAALSRYPIVITAQTRVFITTETLAQGFMVPTNQPTASRPKILCLDSLGLERWQLAWDLQQQLKSRGWFVNRGKLVRFRNYNIDVSGQLSLGGNWVGRSAVSTVTALYGGLHALLWNAHFPSNIEKHLWRASALTIAASGIAMSLFAGVPRLSMLIRETGSNIAENIDLFINAARWRGGHYRAGGQAMSALLFPGGLALCYIAARAFLVIECFISLRSLPLDTYVTPSWTQWLPHL